MNYAEQLAKKKLLLDGWLVEKQNWNKWGAKDLFGCWDFIAVKKNTVRFIQVSEVPLYSRGKAYQKKLHKFPAKHKEYWHLNKKKKLWKITNIK